MAKRSTQQSFSSMWDPAHSHRADRQINTCQHLTNGQGEVSGMQAMVNILPQGKEHFLFFLFFSTRVPLFLLLLPPEAQRGGKKSGEVKTSGALMVKKNNFNVRAAAFSSWPWGHHETLYKEHLKHPKLPFPWKSELPTELWEMCQRGWPNWASENLWVGKMKPKIANILWVLFVLL